MLFTLLTLSLAKETRVRVSSGDANFHCVYDDGSGPQLRSLDNTTAGGGWLKLPAGAQIDVIASYAKTDTYMLSIREQNADGTSKQPYGVVLRQQSYDRLIENCPSELPQASAVEQTLPLESIGGEKPLALDGRITFDQDIELIGDPPVEPTSATEFEAVVS